MRLLAPALLVLLAVAGAVGARSQEGSPTPLLPSTAQRQLSEQPAAPQGRDIELVPDSVLAYNVLVTWYGNPHSTRMGILGEMKGERLARGLREQAAAFETVTGKRIQPAYELVAIVAQGTAGADGMWRRRESKAVIDQMLAEARANKFKLVLDVQVGHSTVKSELEYLRPYLEEPDVYLALDPEFHMAPGQQPGRQIGSTPSEDINYAIDLLEGIIARKKLPPKVLIVHQFTMNMVPDKRRVKASASVDVALVMDGWGARALKLAIYRMVTRTPLEFSGIKLFYRKEPDLFTPAMLLALTPEPAVVIYQ